MADGGTDKQEARIAALWEALDTRRKGKLDFDDLRAGLRHTDHRTSFYSHYGTNTANFISQPSKMLAAYSRMYLSESI